MLKKKNQSDKKCNPFVKIVIENRIDVREKIFKLSNTE